MSLPIEAQSISTPLWFCVRQNGRTVRDGWIDEVPLSALARHLRVTDKERVEVCIVNRRWQVTPNSLRTVFRPRKQGILGIEYSIRDKSLRYAPTQMLATNRSFTRTRQDFLKRFDVNENEFAEHGKVYALSCKQFLIQGRQGSTTKLVRGSQEIAPTTSLDLERVSKLAEGISKWMLKNLSDDGSLPYKYWPSRGTESSADNAIRRFLASISLAKYANLHQDSRLKRIAKRNIRYNLRRYFQPIDERRGVIVEAQGAKLGATALAGLAILEARLTEVFKAEFEMLSNAVASLVDDKFGFRTFFFPSERDGENWNFYTGEALLFWAKSIQLRANTAPNMAQCAKVFKLCRDHHRRNRNPAFVPWHTQACVTLFGQSGDQEFADFVFEINDWLLKMQQWDDVESDLRGRFYNPARPDFGPPHAASTGVYLEGLADACSLARSVSDGPRLSTYERALNRGMRSLRQLQYRNANDAFYISKKNRVMGALRTEVYDNAVRIDSAAHALLAAVKILASSTSDEAHIGSS